MSRDTPALPPLLPALLCLLALTVPVAAAMFRVWVNQDAVHIGYALSTESERRRGLEELREKLQVELAAERAPGRLERLGEKLGLAPPRADQVFGGSTAARTRDGT